MSLAQKVERQAADAELPSAPPRPRTMIPVDFRDLTRRPAAPTAVVPAKAEAMPAAAVLAAPAPKLVAAPRPASVSRKGSDVALDLLNEVSRAFPVLVERCAKLEAALAQARKQAQAELAAASEVARERQQIATALKQQVEGLEKGLKAMKQRAEAAEQQVASMREASDRSQHAAAEAECLSSLFQDKVIASFGENSPIHPLLESLRSPSPILA